MTIDPKSLIRQALSNQADTFSTDPRSDREATMAPVAVMPTRVERPPVEGFPRGSDLPYLPPVTATANDVAAVLRDELRDRSPHLPGRKMFALLYLAQVVCLTANDTPLFDEIITATDTGVQIADLSTHAVSPLDNTQLAVALLTASRYGGLSAADLEATVRGQSPWQAARNTTSRRIESEQIRAWVRGLDDDPDATVTGVSRTAMAALRGPGAEPSRASDSPDSPEEIAAFIADAKARL